MVTVNYVLQYVLLQFLNTIVTMVFTTCCLATLLTIVFDNGVYGMVLQVVDFWFPRCLAAAVAQSKILKC